MRAKKHGDQTHSHPMFCDEIPRIFLTAPPSYAAVAIDLGQCEQCLRYKKLATSSFRVTTQELARTLTNSRADPWSWIAAYVATRDPSDGSGPDRSCLDDGGVARVSSARRVPWPTAYHRTSVSRMECSASQQL